MKFNGRFEKSILYGVGLDDTDYPKERRVYFNGKSKIIWYCRTFSRWRNMLKRCYSGTDHAYRDVSVCDAWLKFSNYKMWVDNQIKPNVEWDVDKDLISGKAREYSEETCVILPKNLNMFLVVSVGKGLVGSYYDASRNKYQAYCNEFGGKRVSLGRHETEHQAHKMWQVEKVRQLRVAKEWYSKQIYSIPVVVSSLSKIIRNVEFDISTNNPTLRLYT